MNTSLQKKIAMPTVWLVVLLGSLSAFGPLSMDMYLPGLPIVAEDLNASTSLVQLSLTACLIGLGAGQLIFGPLSDIYGRRKPLVITLSVYAIASVLCAFSPNIWIFVALRFVQGMTGAAGIVIARACARDLYVGNELTKFMAMLSIVSGSAPILSPIIGGVVLNYSSWHTVFLLLGVIGLLMFLSTAFFLPDTLPVEARAESGMLAVVKTFSGLLKDKWFLGIALTQGLIMSGMFAYIAGSPFVLQNIYNVTAQQFSLFFAMNGVGIITAAQVTGRLSGKIHELKFLRAGVLLSFTASILLLLTVWNEWPLAVIATALFFMVSSVGLVSPAAFSLAMQSQGKSAGSASAFLGLLPFIGGAIVSPLVGLAGDSSAWPLSIIVLTCSTAALVIYFTVVRKAYRLQEI
ncbi:MULTISPECIES: multidrug effflux MFS transporter [unclassified Sporosarcina]|uniref:multidrug effflux MFS transporter n=1 Tax=unclassified Sporosarcina TaxID=2647733 RepID=UPI000C169993|nr:MULTISPECIES: multidrug effflux MFS transporter [unclassified Sporosarcina]PIC98335.1 MFS transporter [Sporosarcina sp. P29]PID05962.1 MFS transporter [Sporosarcina sp. P30]PID09156.1 MFS transporter [Sporosarcina sp. P31]PID12454.1 MFS transporter [Sporosarcina sp. P32b]